MRGWKFFVIGFEDNYAKVSLRPLGSTEIVTVLFIDTKEGGEGGRDRPRQGLTYAAQALP